MKVDICIFVFAIISTSVHSCQPGGGAGGGEGDTTTAKTEEFSRKKRNAGLGTSEKCSSVEFDVITDQKNTPEKTLNNSGELELKVIKSLQQGFDNTLDSMKLQKAGLV
uniref:Uncharacterized protein n=1 Tax=Setaria digitata TaxID=48799 RepID=A0A915Q1Y2_9BILA